MDPGASACQISLIGDLWARERERDPISEARYMAPERKIPKVSLWFPRTGAHTDRTTAASAAAEKEG